MRLKCSRRVRGDTMWCWDLLIDSVGCGLRAMEGREGLLVCVLPSERREGMLWLLMCCVALLYFDWIALFWPLAGQEEDARRCR